MSDIANEPAARRALDDGSVLDPRLRSRKPRRARTDDEVVLDAHDRLLVAIEQQATDWMSDAQTLQDRGSDSRTVNGYRTHAEQLRAIARIHSRRHW